MIPFGKKVKTNLIKEVSLIHSDSFNNNSKLNKYIKTKRIRFGYVISQNVESIIHRIKKVKMTEYYDSI